MKTKACSVTESVSGKLRLRHGRLQIPNIAGPNSEVTDPATIRIRLPEARGPP
jgi:hypothetical protein